MKKLVKNILWTLLNFVFCSVYAVVESLKYVFVGKNVIGKLGIISAYAGMVALGFFKPIAFWVVFGIIGLLNLVIAIAMVKSRTTYKKNESNESYKEYRSEHGYKKSFFDGMSVEEAKKEYRKLMKMYHPDNANGDEEMSKKVSAAYNQYRATHGR